MLGTWMKEFVASGWNIFDTLIVIISFLAIWTGDLPGNQNTFTLNPLS